MANKNRSRGHDLERWIVSWLNSLNIFNKQIVTTRSCNKRLDDKGVDICYEDASKTPFNIQAKSSISRPNYIEILDKMPKGNNIIIHEHVVKQKTRFYKKDKYVIMKIDLFEELIKDKNYE